MKRAYWAVLVSLFLGAFVSVPVKAQDTDFVMDIVEEPICFMVKNEASYEVIGSFVTNYYMRRDGMKARHRSNFRLDPVGSVHAEGYPLDMAEFCTYGPFYEGRKIEFVIRTLVPVFSCITRIEDGPIVIHGKRRDDDMGNETWADCYE